MDGCLIIEGGALRGIHTSGVLDVLMKNEIYMSSVIGVSAGALNGFNYISRQPGRSARANLEFIKDERYFNLLNIARRKSVFGFDFMFGGMSEIMPFDSDTFENSAQKFFIVATNVDTGKPVYFEKGVCSDIFAAGAASASLPFLSPPVTIEGREYIDGGISDPVPIEKALADGYGKIVVVLTRHKGFRKPAMPIPERETAKMLYKDKPELLEVILNTNKAYNETLDLIDRLEEEGRIFALRPSSETGINFFDTDSDRLGFLYQTGITDAGNSLDALRKYLGIKTKPKSCRAGGVRKYDISDYASENLLYSRVQTMNSFGSRLTGSEGQRKFIRYLKNEIRKMNLEIYSDPHFFDRWEEKDRSLVIHSPDGAENISVSSVFPYSGETDEKGVTAELVYAGGPIEFINARDKILVTKVNKPDFLPSSLSFDRRRAKPKDVDLPKNYTGPIAASFYHLSLLKAAKLAGARAAVCVWDGMSDESIKGQYLPFVLDYQGIPAVWVNAAEGKKVIDAAEAHRNASFTLTAEKESCARTETFYCMIEGENKEEAVIINSHTDGTNCIEENGAIAMLSLIDCLRGKKLNRTHIFVFVTGHFRLPMFKSPLGGGVQATSKWLGAHPDLWDGKGGHLKAVAGLSIEHLGCMEWKDVDGVYAKTGNIETEIVYTGNKIMDEIYYRALEGRSRVRTLTLRSHNLFHFGEGQPLFNAKIPEIAFVASPDSLCVVSESHEMEKFDAELMMQQTQTFLNCLTMIDDMPKSAIGSCEQNALIRVRRK